MSKRKYDLNEGVFQNLNPVSAYWLGFLAADGFISNKSGARLIKLKLAEKDISQIQNFIKFVETNAPIKYDQGHPYIVLCSTQMVNDIKKYLPSENKADTLSLPDLDKNLIRHFIRGYFDGDGWTTIFGPTLCLGIVGNGPIITELSHHLIDNNIKCAVFADKRSQAFSIRFASRTAINNFYNYCHGNLNPRLHRKWSIIEEWIRIPSSLEIKHLRLLEIDKLLDKNLSYKQIANDCGVTISSVYTRASQNRKKQ